MTQVGQIKERIYKTKIQIIQISQDGEVLDSENSIFSVKKGEKISSLHPFFEGIESLLEHIVDPVSFPCVNLNIENKHFLVDIEILKNENHLFLSVLDFTDHYEQSHPLLQEKNEASIVKYRLSYERDLLLAKEEFKNKFLAHLNHEIRNPLNSMFGFMEILSNSKLDYEQKETLNILHKTSMHLKVLMDDLMDISKIEQGALEVKYVPFLLGDLLNSIIKHFNPQYNKKNLALHLNVDEKIPTKVLGDPTRLNQILYNLIENAHRNTEKGEVTVDVGLDEKKSSEETCHLTFKVSDTGVGIDEEELPMIFESYYQIGLDEIKPLGRGLGLKIVQDLVSLMKGEVKVVSKKDVGTTFVTTLPFDLFVPNKERKTRTVPKGSGIVLSRRVLIVENNEIDQMLFVKTFINKGEYHIEIAKDANQAMHLMERRTYYLVILKTKLPGEMNGVQLVKTIRNHQNDDIRALPILMVSGNVMADQQEMVLKAGVSDFLSKPYTSRELFKKVDKLVSRPTE